MKTTLAALYVLRAQLELAIELLEGSAPIAGCPHPEDKRIDCSTGGGAPPMFFCRDCEQEIAGTV